MKSFHVLLLASLLSCSGAFAAEKSTSTGSEMLPELRGVLVMGSEQRFSLSSAGAAQTAWVSVGESFGGWQVVSYAASEETLVLKKDGREQKIHLAGSQVKQGDANVKATIAEAEEVLRKMNFEVMIKKIMDQQKQSVIAMTKQMSARMGSGGASPDDIAAHQAKIMDIMFKEMNIEGMKDDFARIYSDVFTKSELAGYSDFLTTPAGQAMVDKQPLMQQKMMEVLTPKMMAAMPKIQQASMEFAQEQKAKQQAAKAAAQAATGTTTGPQGPK